MSIEGTLLVLATHLLIAVALIIDIISIYRADNDEYKSKWDESERTSSIVALVLLSLHLLLYPGNWLLKQLGLDRLIIRCNACSCFSGSYRQLQTMPDCDSLAPGKLKRQVAANIVEELHSLNRMPIVRQVVATAILSILAYNAGATYGKHDSQLRAISLIAYSAYDIVGRNKL